MALSAGDSLGVYEILGPLGAGGMGEVYRARDGRLSREIAIKLLPDEVAGDRELLARFEREARLLAAFQHPRIAAIYGLEESDGRRFLIMELVAGQTLADRMARGALSLDEALPIARQIAEGLEAAHEKGIVHRDLKPSNVQLGPDGSVKLLDFGLARAFERESREGSASLSMSPTISERMTATGIILGTAAYMSPEQARGRTVDRRADLWALGVVLYETLTGRRLFTGETVSDTLAAVLRADPDWSALPADTPPAIRRLLKRCLERDARSRLHDAGDARLEIEEGIREWQGGGASESAAPRARPWRWAVPLVAGLLLGAGSAAVLLLLARPPAQSPPAIRFGIPPPEGTVFASTVENSFSAFSPDGSRLAFIASDTNPGRSGGGITVASGRRIWLRDLSSLEARPIPGTDGAISVFWSPDGKTIAFFAGGKLRRLDAAGGAPVSICDAPGTFGYSGSWGSEGQILFASIQGTAIYRVSANGGQPVKAVEPNLERGDLRVLWPAYLPDGESFLYYRRGTSSSGTTIGEVMLERPGEPPRHVLSAHSRMQYVEPGRLLFVRDGTLVAQRFDARSGSVSGNPVAIAERVRSFTTTGNASFTVSNGGSIALQDREDTNRVAWVERDGRESPLIAGDRMHQRVAISPDGRRVLLDRDDPITGTLDIWIRDLARAVESRVSSDPDTEAAPEWLPDGRSIVYMVARGQPQLARRDLIAEKEEFLVAKEGLVFPDAVSPDGSTLVYRQRSEEGHWNLRSVSLTKAGKSEVLLASPFSEFGASFSPDGRFLAFLSNESGRFEAYVGPIATLGERTPVSTAGARFVRWSRDGRELFYLSSDNRVVSVAMATSPTLSIGAATTLFSLPPDKRWLDFDVAPDGRFLAVIEERDADALPLTVVVEGLPPGR